MADLKELKRRIDIVEVLKEIGARVQLDDSWDDEVKVWCPFCADAASTKPAGSANVMKGLYYCYQCAFGGSVIDIALQYAEAQEPVDDVFGSYSPSIAKAVEWLEERWPAPKEEEGDDPWTT